MTPLRSLPSNRARETAADRGTWRVPVGAKPPSAATEPAMRFMPRTPMCRRVPVTNE